MVLPNFTKQPLAKINYFCYRAISMNLEAPISTAPVSSDAPAVAKPRGRPRKTLEEREDGNRKSDLVAAAAKLFRKKGFDATSTRDIATAVGMRSGSPFYHFKSKGDLLYAVMAEGMRSAIEKQQLTLQNANISLSNKEQSKQETRRLLQCFDTPPLRGFAQPEQRLYPGDAVRMALAHAAPAHHHGAAAA